MEHRLLELGKNHNLQTSEGKLAYYHEAAKLLAVLDSPVERDLYAGRLSEILSVSKEAILQEIDSVRQKKQRQEIKQQLPNLIRQEKREMQSVNPDAVKFERAAAAEESLLGTLILHPDYIRQVRATLPAEQMMTEFNRGLYQRLLDRDRQGLLVELAFLAADYDEAGMAYIARMVRDVGDRIVNPEEVARCAAVIREEYALRHMNDPSSASDEDIQAMMEALRKRKQ